MNEKVGVILGGTQGIGRALVAALARRWGRNAFVYLTARREADGAKVVQDLARAGVTVGVNTRLVSHRMQLNAGMPVPDTGRMTLPSRRSAMMLALTNQ